MKAKDPILRFFPGRCRQCYMRENMCICDLIPDINNHTYVTVIMHHRESYKTTNTARMACMALRNSQILLRGLKDDKLNLDHIHNPQYQSILLTLSDRSEPLTSDFVSRWDRPLHLIVPDGNWRQANKMGLREPALHHIPWVKLPPGPPSNFRLRREHHPEGLATLEAIARALSVIESPEIEHKLIALFDIMVSRTLLTRPKP